MLESISRKHISSRARARPILMGGMSAIIVPPLPPILDNLNITPAELELGENVTISFEIRNIDSQSITYAVDIHIENVNDPPPTWPPMDIYLRIWVDLEAYESKKVSHTLTMDMVGDFNVTVDGMTGSFTVKAQKPPPKPAEFVVSNLTVTPEFGFDIPFEIGEFVICTVLVKNIGEMEGTYPVEWKVDGETIDTQNATLAAGRGRHTRAYFKPMSPGTYQFSVGDLTETFIVRVPLEPAEFEFSNLRIFYPGVIPPEVERGETVTVTVSVDVTNLGEETGVYTVELVLDGSVVGSEKITPLGGGMNTTVLFELTRGEGTYEVEVAGITDSFTVIAPEIPFWMRPGNVAVIIVIIIAAAAILYANWKRKLPSISPEIDMNKTNSNARAL